MLCAVFLRVPNTMLIFGIVRRKLLKELCLRERMADIIEAATNLEFRNRLYQEFSI